MVEKSLLDKQLELSNRILIKLKEEKDILLKRQKLIMESDLIDFHVETMSNIETSKPYLETIQGLKLNSIENRLIQIEGELEGVTMQIKELKDGKNKDK